MPYKAELRGNEVIMKRKGKDDKPTTYENGRHRIVRKKGLPKSELELQGKIDKEERDIKNYFTKSPR
jgi:hypothetical protein